MSQRIAYYIATGITAFMLFTAGGLVRITSQSQAAATQVTTTSAPVEHDDDEGRG